MLDKEAQPTGEKEFYVKTPMGTLHVHSKYNGDNDGLDYPGVYVDLIQDGCDMGLDKTIACIEYDSCAGDMLTTAYDIGGGEPAFAYHHRGPICEEDEGQMEIPTYRGE